ncbi:hypothetical protein ACLKA6_005230 [Drosophila palustris]
MDPFGSSWNNPNLCIPSGAQVWYTDGSKLENGDTGAGVYGPRFRRSIAMGKTPSIFQAEIHAIEVCAIECIRRRMQGATIFILSDSQAALKALESFKITSKLVDNCLRKLDCLGERNTLTVGWIPGHEGHEGNEIADCLAKKGAIKPLIGPEPFCGLARGHTMEVIRNWEEKKLSMYWIDSDGQRQAKRFLIPARNQSKRMVGLRKSYLRILTDSVHWSRKHQNMFYVNAQHSAGVGYKYWEPDIRLSILKYIKLQQPDIRLSILKYIKLQQPDIRLSILKYIKLQQPDIRLSILM